MVNRKELDPEGSPGERFGQRLRALRDERGWTQDELGQRMGCSGTHISAVETGRRPPTLRFAKRADRALGTGDMLERLSRAVRQTALIEGFPEYLTHEARAAEIRLYEVGVVPGLLQTPEYAAALEADAVRREAITPEQADERVKLVARRQATLVRSPSPLIFAVLDEGCIRRPMGAPSVMDAQFARLLEFAEMPNTVLQVAPFSMGARRPFSLPVTVLTLPDRSLMSYAESAHRGHLERERTFVIPILTAYHQLQADAYSQVESVAMIEQLRKGTPVTESPLWFKSSHSGNGGQCIEIAANLVTTPGVVPVRDSKDPHGPALAFPPGAFSSFVAGVKSGEFGSV